MSAMNPQYPGQFGQRPRAGMDGPGRQGSSSSTFNGQPVQGIIISLCVEVAQQRYKQQHDKRAQPPVFKPAQRVWLYCTKVLCGKAPKLHCKWVGPYYITQVGPNHTFKLRNCATNKEVRSLVNARRLKPYYDPADRSTNPPPELEHNDAELDPEEIPDQDQPQAQQPEARQPEPNRPFASLSSNISLDRGKTRGNSHSPRRLSCEVPSKQQKSTASSKQQTTSKTQNPSYSKTQHSPSSSHNNKPKVQKTTNDSRQNTSKFHSSQTPFTSSAYHPPSQKQGPYSETFLDKNIF